MQIHFRKEFHFLKLCVLFLFDVCQFLKYMLLPFWSSVIHWVPATVFHAASPTCTSKMLLWTLIMYDKNLYYLLYPKNLHVCTKLHPCQTFTIRDQLHRIQWIGVQKWFKRQPEQKSSAVLQYFLWLQNSRILVACFFSPPVYILERGLCRESWALS